ncbi:MAG: YaaL family protein [Ruminiclostridium sp.]|nr:YaaL family protein [Ruminiclostridium sp.]
MDMKGYGLVKRLFQFRENEMESEQLDPEKDKAVLLKHIKLARQDWLSALSNFEQAQDPDLIDYYIYKMKACQVRYNYLLKKAKEIGLKQNIYCG